MSTLSVRCSHAGRGKPGGLDELVERLALGYNLARQLLERAYDLDTLRLAWLADLGLLRQSRQKPTVGCHWS